MTFLHLFCIFMGYLWRKTKKIHLFFEKALEKTGNLFIFFA